MTKHEQLWQEFCEEQPYSDRPFDGFLDYVIERLFKAEAERDRLRTIAGESFVTIARLNDELDEYSFNED